MKIPAAEQARLGIVSVTLEPRSVAAGVDAIIRSVDPSDLAALNSELRAANAAAAASDSELRRVADLAAQDRSASQQALELARARAAADAAAVSLLVQRLGLEWGPGFATRTDEARGKLVDDVSSGGAALLRADAPGRPGGVLGRVHVDVDDDTDVSTAELLGFSGTTDPRMQTIGLYCVLRGDPARTLRPGRVLRGRIETDEKWSGVVLPRSALVRYQGRVWAYLRTGGQDFVRREVVGGVPVADGWFVAAGFGPGMEIVSAGAGSAAAFEQADEADEDN